MIISCFFILKARSYSGRGCNFGAVAELFFKRQAIEEISLLGLTASTKDLLSSRQVGAAHQG